MKIFDVSLRDFFFNVAAFFCKCFLLRFTPQFGGIICNIFTIRDRAGKLNLCF